MKSIRKEEHRENCDGHNRLLVSIGRKSRHNWLFQAFLEERFTLLVSTEVLLEYEKVITRRTRPEIAADVLKTLLAQPNCECIEPYYRWNLITEDPTDNKFVDVVFAGRAEHLITEDSHFSTLREIDFPPMSIKSIQEFSAIVGYTIP
jgi:putative PIN family toxin of toxin-antitoxin system